MAEKFSNDTTLTRLGDFYQHIIALQCCINAEEGDVIYIEQRGDVANEDSTFEVKHHIGGNYMMSDNHVDFWKTLKNWIENFETILSYKNLILYTTAEISKNSKLIQWNTLDKKKKFEVIKEIKNNEKSIPKTIEDFVKKVFNFNTTYTEEHLLSILDRFLISAKQLKIEDKTKSLLQHTFFKVIPPKNRAQFFDLLLGYISSIGRKNPHDWKINVSEFYSFARYNLKDYDSATLPIPNLYRSSTENINNYSEFAFVKELKAVNLEVQIQSAVNDYFRTMSTVTYLMDNEPIVSLSANLSDYQDSIVLTAINLVKDEHSIDLNEHSSEEQKILQSKKCYFKAMLLPLMLVPGYDPNQDFFQRGTIHSLVNSEDNNFSWQYK